MRYRWLSGNIRWRSRRIRRAGISRTAAASKTPIETPRRILPRQWLGRKLGWIGCRRVDEHAERSVKAAPGFAGYACQLRPWPANGGFQPRAVVIRGRKFTLD